MRRAPRPPSRCPRAFTLIEVLLALAIVAVLALLALPSGAQAGRERLRAAARMLVADLELAQHLSMGNAADPCLLIIDPDGLGYTLAHSSDPSTPIEHPTSKGFIRTRFGEGRAAAFGGVRIDDHQLEGDDRLAFTSDGATDQPTPATLTLAGNAPPITITITITIDPMTGRVSTQ